MPSRHLINSRCESLDFRCGAFLNAYIHSRYRAILGPDGNPNRPAFLWSGS